MKEYIFSKTFLIELLVSGVLIYKYPYLSLLTSGLIVGLFLYNQSQKISSIHVKNIHMKAALYDIKGDFTITNIPVPKFGANELLIQVKAGAINPVDYKIRTCNIPFFRWFTYPTVGRDFSGVVVDMGKNVTNFRIGDEVYGNAVGGSLQDFTNVKENQIALKANNITFGEAASIGLAGGTSLQALKFWGDLNRKKVLIIGASGGCGSLGVQIAKYFNAHVTGVCSARNVEFVKSLGVDEIVDYTRDDYLNQLQIDSFDLIYDTVTSPEDSNQEVIFKKFLKEGGKYVAINGTATDWIRTFLNEAGIKCERRNYHLTLLKWNTEDLDLMRRMTEENKLKSKCQYFEFDKKNVNGAFDLLKGRRTVGKIVFEI